MGKGMQLVVKGVTKFAPTNMITSHLEEEMPELRRVTSLNTISNRSEFSPYQFRCWMKDKGSFVRVEKETDTSLDSDVDEGTGSVTSLNGPDSGALALSPELTLSTDSGMMDGKPVPRSLLQVKSDGCLRVAGSFEFNADAKRKVSMSPTVSVRRIEA